jgi:hypothetical protein
MLQLHLARSENIAIIVGVTDSGGANLALGTLAPNPHLGNRNVVVLVEGEGCYVEDDGTDRPRQSGVSSDGTTIDIRSSVTSAAFVALVIALGPGEAHTVDHSAVTT